MLLPIPRPRRPADRDMAARWRNLSYDALTYNLARHLGDDYEKKWGHDLMHLDWEDLPHPVREKIKDDIKAEKVKAFKRGHR